MCIYVSIKRVELSWKNYLVLVKIGPWIIMWRQLDNFLVVLNSFLVVFFLGLQISKIHINIGEHKLFLNKFLCFDKMLFGLIKLAGLKTESSKPVMIVACKQLLIKIAYCFELLVRGQFAIVSENVLEKSVPFFGLFSKFLLVVNLSLWFHKFFPLRYKIYIFFSPIFTKKCKIF